MKPYIAFEKENGNNSVVVLDHNWEAVLVARLGGKDIGKLEYIPVDLFVSKYRYRNVL